MNFLSLWLRRVLRDFKVSLNPIRRNFLSELFAGVVEFDGCSFDFLPGGDVTVSKTFLDLPSEFG